MTADLWPYLILVVVGFLPNEVWRWLGVFFSRGLDETSEALLWVRAVATAILTGVVAKIIVFAPGALAGVPLWIRLGSAAVGMAAFALFRQSVFAGVVAGTAALIAADLVIGR
ncbi:MAG: AzlD domain-containing protein [Rhodoplanes sp.]|uniref:AzlD domain-containing protein n=1 Tax=Rhodoplanes sp. TaxID=1968906 RepID=UPI0018572001|nr:AzlD domain-containing protein [Rhodoplanes sp.]NVO17054.1 AzlD domain-containing protein [Rhodoplanes sp.]